jgi:hypothetical protein
MLWYLISGLFRKWWRNWLGTLSQKLSVGKHVGSGFVSRKHKKFTALILRCTGWQKAKTAERKARLGTFRFRNFMFWMEYHMIYVCLLETEHFGMLYLVERRFVIECIHLLKTCFVSCFFFGLNDTSAVKIMDRVSKMSATNSILILRYEIFAVWGHRFRLLGFCCPKSCFTSDPWKSHYSASKRLTTNPQWRRSQLHSLESLGTHTISCVLCLCFLTLGYSFYL